MRVLVTGATGFLGRRLVAQAAASGHDVVAVGHAPRLGPSHSPTPFSSTSRCCPSRSGPSRSGPSRSGPGGRPWPPYRAEVVWIGADLSHDDSLDTLAGVGRVDAIVHTAYVQRGPALAAVTAEAPGRIAALAAAQGAHLVHLSSDVVFAGRDEPYTESDPPDPVHEYGLAKATAERLVQASGADALIVRTSLLYARWHDADTGPQEALAADPSVRFFTDEVRCPAAADDVAAGILAALAARAVGMWHLVGVDPVDRLTFARLLAERRGLDSSRLHGGPAPEGGPPRPGRLVLRSRTPLPGALEVLGR